MTTNLRRVLLFICFSSWNFSVHAWSPAGRFFITQRRAVRKGSLSGRAEDGVSLRSLGSPEKDAKYLETSVTQWLDDEYIPQEVHATIGRAVALAYQETWEREQGTDLGSILMAVGTRLEALDMGDAFVGPWDVANAASDFLMARLGREMAACCIPAAIAEGAEAAIAEAADASRSSLQPAEGEVQQPSRWSSGGDSLQPAEVLADLKEALASNFLRYKFLGEVLEEDAGITWEALSLVVGMVARDVGLLKDYDEGEPLAMRSASDLECALFKIVLADLPEEDTDDRDFLQDLARGVIGEAAARIAEEEEDHEFMTRYVLVQFLFDHDFLNKGELWE